MDHRIKIGFCLVLSACGADARAPSAAQSAATAAPPASPSHTAAAAPADEACNHPAAQQLNLDLGVDAQTPWPLRLSYAIDDDAKHGPGYMFLLHSGERRWQTRRDSNNWTRSMMWRGYCWRGVGHAGVRAARVQVEIMPLCKDGKLMEMGSCGDAFKP